MSALDDIVLLRNQYLKQIEDLKHKRDRFFKHKSRLEQEIIVIGKNSMPVGDLFRIINDANWDKNQTTLFIFNGEFRLSRLSTPKNRDKHEMRRLSAEIYSLERKVLKIDDEIVDIVER